MPDDPRLIVDDNPQSLRRARLLLAAGGYDARTAVDAEQALALMEELMPKYLGTGADHA